MAAKKSNPNTSSNYANLRRAGYGPKRAKEVATRHAANAADTADASMHMQGGAPVDVPVSAGCVVPDGK